MKYARLVLLATLLAIAASDASPQELSNFERATRAFAASMPAAMKSGIQEKLAAEGRSAAEVQDVFARAIEDYSYCAVTAALDQGRSQGISEDAVLHGLNGRLGSTAPGEDFRGFDYDAWEKRLLPCRQQLGKALGITIQ